jgi:hypothetical protein
VGYEDNSSGENEVNSYESWGYQEITGAKNALPFGLIYCLTKFIK